MDISLMFLMAGAITDRSLSQQERAFAAKLYAEYYPLIRSRAAKVTKTASDREDLVHDCYLQLLTHIDRLIGLEKPQLIRYIERVVLSCRQEFTAQDSHIRYEDLSEDQTADIRQEIEQKEMCLAFHEQFGKLTDRDQRLLYLRYIEELSLEEIGAYLHRKPASVNTQLYRIRKRARRLMQEMYDEKYPQTKESTEDA
jgi:RNA polymerase sigma-70 factor (ECF subfamily)